MDKKKLLWLYNQLPLWEEKGWIDGAQAEAMRAHYGEIPVTGPSLSRLILLAGGSILIGLGILLLFAGYWYSFSPNGRFDWALVLLGIAIALAAIGIGSVRKGSVLSEGIGVIYVLSLAATTLLVADTYYTGEYIGLHLLIILLCSIPIIYLLDAGVALILYLIGVMSWSFTNNALNVWVGPPAVWGLILIALPYYWRRLHTKRENDSLILWISWAFVGAVFGSMFFTLSFFQPEMNLFFIALLSALAYCIGSAAKNRALWTLPFRGCGTLGLFYVIVEGTFITTWSQIGEAHISGWFMLLCALSLGAIVYLLKELVQKRRIAESMIGAAPIIIGGCYLASQQGGSPLYISVMFNVYILLTAAVLGLQGTLMKRISLVNGSILSLIGIFGARFFDPSFTFIERGMAFFILGIVVIVANAIYMWRKGKKQAKINQSVRQAKKRLEVTAPALEEGEEPISGEAKVQEGLDETVETEQDLSSQESPSEEEKGDGHEVTK